MKRWFAPVTVLTILALGATALASPDQRTITVEKGRLKILHLPFEASTSAGSNSSVVDAKLDVERKRMFFIAREVGEASYTLIEGEHENARKIQVTIRVIEPTDG
jgi:hypothetical protein